MELTPKQVVRELDRYIIGQDEAKRAVAVALRNRWRRRQLPASLREEVVPKNILMIGPTGVGKTEIARRLARLAQAPFIKVEATKFTEIGYVGRDVESIIRDMLEIAITMTRKKMRESVRVKAEAEKEKMKANLLRSVSHDLRTPLTSIIGYLELLSGKVEIPAEMQKKYIPVHEYLSLIHI